MNAKKKNLVKSTEKATWSFQCPENGIPMFAKFDGGKLVVESESYLENDGFDAATIDDANTWARSLNRNFDNASDAAFALRQEGADLS
jgi:hypothetical protein